VKNPRQHLLFLTFLAALISLASSAEMPLTSALESGQTIENTAVAETAIKPISQTKPAKDNFAQNREENSMSWFESLTGFREESPVQVRKNLIVEGNKIKSLVNGKAWIYGQLETPTLAELRHRANSISTSSGKLKLLSIVGNVQNMHSDPANANAIFQVASQFNLLEMIGPQVTPEQGIAIYEHDHTQGPACAISAGAGTIYRNYFVAVNGQIGQSVDNQIDCLADLGAALGNTGNRLWKMQNGYAIPTSLSALEEINTVLQKSSAAERDKLRELLRIGILWQTEVTLNNARHTVSQAYCSALPGAYSSYAARSWEGFARLVLEAAYEATICAAILNAQKTGSNRLFLTTLGGGAFGNKRDWIFDAIKRAVNLYRHHDLEVYIVSYGSADSAILQLIKEIEKS